MELREAITKLSAAAAMRLSGDIDNPANLGAWLEAANRRSCLIECCYIGAGEYAPRDMPYPAGIIKLNVSYPTRIVCRILIHELCHHELHWFWGEVVALSGLSDLSVLDRVSQKWAQEAICTECEDLVLPMPADLAWDGLPAYSNEVVVRTPQLMPRGRIRGD